MAGAVIRARCDQTFWAFKKRMAPMWTISLHMKPARYQNIRVSPGGSLRMEHKQGVFHGLWVTHRPLLQQHNSLKVARIGLYSDMEP